MYRLAYGPPILGFIFPGTSVDQLMYFFEENTEVYSIFLYKNRNARPNLRSYYIIYIYIILYVIIYYYYCHHIFNKYLHI